MKHYADAMILAERVRAQNGDITERHMFGGITFLLNGNMLCCASKQGLMVRVGKDAEAKALASPFARPRLGSGRRMAGFIMVAPDGIADAKSLRRWLAMARAYVGGLPPKAKSAKP